MKLNPNVSSSRRKSRKAHFGAHSEARRKLMSAGLSRDLFEKHHVSCARYYVKVVLILDWDHVSEHLVESRPGCSTALLEVNTRPKRSEFVCKISRTRW